MRDARQEGTALEDAGRLLIAGIEGPDTVSVPESLDFLEEIQPFGVILFQRNLPDLDATLSLTAALRERLPDALLAIDHEGGRVHRLPVPFTRFPPALAISRRGDPRLHHDVGLCHARELRAAGFDLNFAPVLDVFTNPDNQVIGDRAFGETPEEVIHNALPYYLGLTEGGMLGCGKHFPGHGDTLLDSHEALPRIRHDADRLRSLEMVPFARAIAQGFAMIMTAHIVCDALDPDVPASMSPVVIGDYLRRILGFRGVIVSDDLEMKAIAANYDVGEAAVSAVRAGTDLLLVCKRSGLIRATRDSLATAIVEGRISEAALAQSRRRRAALHKKVRKLAAATVDPAEIGSVEHGRLASMLA